MDLLNDVTDIAELAKLAAKFGAMFDLTPPSADDAGYRARMHRADYTRADNELARAVLLMALAADRPPAEVLDGVRRYLTDRMHVAVDQRLSDVAGMGEG